MSQKPVIWVLTDGRAGNRAQALGLAEAVGGDISEKVIHLSKPWIWLPPRYWPPGILGIQGTDYKELSPPWPDAIITCGRRAIGTGLELVRRSGGQIKAIHIQHPHMNLARFDLVISPAHDRLSGENVMVTSGSVHRITEKKLQQAAREWRPRLSILPDKKLAVLVGGSNAAYRMDIETARKLGADLVALSQKTGCGIMATLSRRTGSDAAEAFRKILSELGDKAQIWSGEGENPYLGYLGLADRILVTADSVNMISEACATAKPVQIIPLPVHSANRARKFARFHRRMIDADAARFFEGGLLDWTVKASDDTTKAAARVRALL